MSTEHVRVGQIPRRTSLIWCALAYALSILAGPAAAQPVDAEREFRRGLKALHEFEYEEANQAFVRAEALDSSFVMGYWGEAMTYHQALWRHENIDAARSVLRRLGRTPAERAARCRNPKEAELLHAIETLFADGDATARRGAYAEAMQGAHARFPDDADIAALYALSLLATATRGLIGTADAHEGHSEGLAGSEIQTRAAAILQSVLASHPDHRGALHYLLHTYDDPDHASLALDAARHYAKIASASHAQHMPSHIFLQLGLWRDAAASDRAAYETSVAWVRQKQAGGALRNFHALSWLQYELLQLGRYRDAWQTIGEIEPVVKATGQTTLLSDLSSMRARFVVETRRWQILAHERNFGNVDELFAIGASAARTGDRDMAIRARDALAARARAPEERDLRPAIALMAQEVAALIEIADGQRDAALDRLRGAARAELRLPPPVGLPQPVKPAPELLGEMLLEAGNPREAIDWFNEALKRSRNRSLSVLGLARAAAALGDMAGARTHYAELLANYDHGDDDLADLTEARQALASPPARVAPSARIVLVMVMAAAAIVLGLVLIRIRGRRKAAPASKNGKRRGSKGRRGRRG